MGFEAVAAAAWAALVLIALVRDAFRLCVSRLHAATLLLAHGLGGGGLAALAALVPIALVRDASLLRMLPSHAAVLSLVHGL